MAKGLPKWAIKQGGGITTKAWRLFRGKKSRGKSSLARKRSSPKRRSYRTYAKKGYHKARGMIGKINLKQIAIGSVAKVAITKIQPFGGAYKNGLDNVILGIALPMVKMDNHDFLTVGIKELIAQGIDDFLLGGSTQAISGGL